MTVPKKMLDVHCICGGQIAERPVMSGSTRPEFTRNCEECGMYYPEHAMPHLRRLTDAILSVQEGTE